MTGFAGQHQAVRNGWSREVLSTGRDSTGLKCCPSMPHGALRCTSQSSLTSGFFQTSSSTGVPPLRSQCRGRGFESLHLHPKCAGQPGCTPRLTRARGSFVRDPCAKERAPGLDTVAVRDGRCLPTACRVGEDSFLPHTPCSDPRACLHLRRAVGATCAAPGSPLRPPRRPRIGGHKQLQSPGHPSRLTVSVGDVFLTRHPHRARWVIDVVGRVGEQ